MRAADSIATPGIENVSGCRDGAATTLEMHHLVATLAGVEHVVETHELRLFSDDEYRAAFERAGLTADVVAGPHPDRDRYVGVLPR